MSTWWIILYVTQWAVLIVFGIVLLALMRQVGVILLRLGPRPPRERPGVGPEIGSLAPALPPSLDGREFVYSRATEGATVLMFVSDGCGSCDLVAPAAAALTPTYQEIQFILVVLATRPATLARFAAQKSSGLPVIADRGLREDFRVTEVPFGIFVDSAGRVRDAGVVNNREHLEELVRRGSARSFHDRLHHTVEVSDISVSISSHPNGNDA